MQVVAPPGFLEDSVFQSGLQLISYLGHIDSPLAPTYHSLRMATRA